MKTIVNSLLFAASVATSVHASVFEYQSTFDLADYTGQSYLSFMQNTVKPTMDVLATDGYAVCDAATIDRAYELSGTKVQGKVARNFGGIDRVKEIAAELEGQTVTLETLPGLIRSIDRSVDIYDLSTFIGLACGGGVMISYSDANYALNVHYDTTEQRSGRSFGVGPTRAANDASDKEYLTDLQAYARGSKSNLPSFYRALFESLLNSDPSGFSEVSPEGQTVLTDFLAVFTAEQARNLMDNKVSPHWDAALLEVTLLAAFHGGQSEVKLYYMDPGSRKVQFTDTTLAQTPCKVPSRSQPAQMRDYWQFSRNITSSDHCRRSGINITNKEFRQLGADITSYMQESDPESLEAVKAAMGFEADEKNVFRALSYAIISDKSPAKHSKGNVKKMTDAWVRLLSSVSKNANEITRSLEH